MSTSALETLKIGISSCLIGQEVRFDSGHKKNDYITNILGDYFEFLPFCPEVEIGLGIPREPIRLVENEGEFRVVGTRNPKLDVTQKLIDIADAQKSWHTDLDGYILKKDSPSCGMERVKTYHNGHPRRNGVGLYAKGLLENFPYLPVEEEGRLGDPHLRENFIQRVYIFSRWRRLLDQGVTVSSLQKFHAKHKYILMSRNQTMARELGASLSNLDPNNIDEALAGYIDKLTEILKIIATRKNHVNTLQHIQGYLKNQLGSDDKAELKDVIEDYRLGLLPLIVPITLLRHHFRKHPNDYITNSYYMSPHPGEMMLLNHI